MNRLIMHCGAIEASEEQVKSILAPEATESFAPVSHDRFIGLLEKTCQEAGIAVSGRKYALSSRQPKDSEFPVIGDRMFGVWNLDRQDEDGQEWALGIRNSHDKSFSLAITAGIKVFVCDNLAFSGEFVAMRKHTSRLDDGELNQIIRGAVVKTMKRLDEFAKWHRALKAIPISELQAVKLLVRGMEKNIVPPKELGHVIDCYEQEMAIGERNPSMYSVFGAFTRHCREFDLFKIADKTAAVEAMIDEQLTFTN